MKRMMIIDNAFDVKKYEKDLQAVIFDLDNILYPLNTYVKSGFRQISRLFLGRSQEVYDQLWDAYGKQCMVDRNGRDDAVTVAICTMLQAQGLFSEEMQQKCLRIYDQHTPSIQPFDGVVELLKELREKGMRLGLLTDGPSEVQREKLRALGVISLFDEIMVTDDIAGKGDVMKFRKPNPICFEIMRLRLDVVYEKMGYVGELPISHGCIQ